MKTRREALQDLITGAPMTPREMAMATQQKIRDVLDDLEHLRRSLGKRFKVREPVCEGCGFVFRKRDRLNTPSRCPRCRCEQIAGPWIEADRDAARP